MTRRGKLVILEIDDGTAKLEVTLFPELLDAHRGSSSPTNWWCSRPRCAKTASPAACASAPSA